MSKLSASKLISFAATERQAEICQAVINHGSNNKAAKALGLDRRTVDRTLRGIEGRAASKAVAPHRNVDNETMEGFEAKRVSTAFNSDGDIDSSVTALA